MTTSSQKNYIPSPDPEFFQWAQQLVSTVGADPAAYGVSPEALTAIQAQETTFDNSYRGMQEQRDAAKAATSQKNQTRKSFEESIRTMVKMIQANPQVDPQQKLTAGLPVHDTKPTPKEIPTNSPDALITQSRLRNEFRFADPSFPSRRYRPSGVTSVEIIGFIGDEAPTSLEQFFPMGFATRMNHAIDFNVMEGGKTVWFRFRWVGTRGETGNWSDAVESKIWS